MTDPRGQHEPAEPNTMLILGEIRGQLREIIHSTNNISQSVTALGIRVSALEAKDNRREGQSGVWVAVLRSPAIGWMVGGATFLWGVLTGRVHL